jgi:hypothetical protein
VDELGLVQPIVTLRQQQEQQVVCCLIGGESADQCPKWPVSRGVTSAKAP